MPAYCPVYPCWNGLHYYRALMITVYTAGNHTIQSNGIQDTFGYLYNNTFDPTYPSVNLLQFNDNGTSSAQFWLSMWLQPMIDYILVATTSLPLTEAAMPIVVQGPAAINLSLINATGQ
jgi:hypothetical protein